MFGLSKNDYELNHTEDIPTPALVYYPEIIGFNTDRVIHYAGGVHRIWAHVKTHKSADVIRILQSKGIRRFKCATIAEAEMAAQCRAEEILLAYPLVGPNIRRFLQLKKEYPTSHFWAIGDQKQALEALGKATLQYGDAQDVLLDVNIGMDRTGVPIEDAQRKYEEFSGIEGIRLRGLHFFSGNFKIADPSQRQRAVDQTKEQIRQIRSHLISEGYPVDAVVLSGTPVMTCYQDLDDVYICPGTAFITDLAYYQTFRDYDFRPAAALLTRVISTPVSGNFTVDLGYKHIAADPKGQRGIILGYEDAQVLFQCEEHWTFHIDPERAPTVGELLYVLPTHVCPTIAQYPTVYAAEHGEITDTWPVTARDLKIQI